MVGERKQVDLPGVAENIELLRQMITSFFFTIMSCLETSTKEMSSISSYKKNEDLVKKRNKKLYSVDLSIIYIYFIN